MKKKALKSSVLMALLAMLGFFSSCNPDSVNIGRMMYGSPQDTYQKKDSVQTKQQAAPETDTPANSADISKTETPNK